MTPNTQTRQLPKPRGVAHPRHPHVQQRRRSRAIKQRLRQRHLPPGNRAALPASTPSHHPRSFHAAPWLRIRPLNRGVSHRRASRANTPREDESPAREPASRLLISNLPIEKLQSVVVPRGQMPPDEFADPANFMGLLTLSGRKRPCSFCGACWGPVVGGLVVVELGPSGRGFAGARKWCPVPRRGCGRRRDDSIKTAGPGWVPCVGSVSRRLSRTPP